MSRIIINQKFVFEANSELFLQSVIVLEKVSLI